jgi:hypothetical protein
LALGVYSAVTLAQARKKRDAARELLASDVDPGAAKQAAKRAGVEAAANTFEMIKCSATVFRLAGVSVARRVI